MVKKAVLAFDYGASSGRLVLGILNEDTKKIFEKAIDELQLSVRMYDKVLKVSRTIADLDNSENIETVHLLEALNYRKKY